MSDSKGTVLPKKPRSRLPAYVHRSNRWAKKVRGQLRYFGKASDDPSGQAALSLWLEQKDDLLANREPRAKSDAVTVGKLCNEFLAHKRKRLRQRRDHAPDVA